MDTVQVVWSTFYMRTKAIWTLKCMQVLGSVGYMHWNTASLRRLSCFVIHPSTADFILCLLRTELSRWLLLTLETPLPRKKGHWQYWSIVVNTKSGVRRGEKKITLWNVGANFLWMYFQLQFLRSGQAADLSAFCPSSHHQVASGDLLNLYVAWKKPALPLKFCGDKNYPCNGAENFNNLTTEMKALASV